MHIITSMYRTLILNDSPVLRDNRVKEEVKNLIVSLKAITSANHPSFFRFTAGKDDQSLLDGNRFPTLVAVAHRLLPPEQPDGRMSQFAGMTNVQHGVIDELVNLHKEAMLKRQTLMAAGDYNSHLSDSRGGV